MSHFALTLDDEGGPASEPVTLAEAKAHLRVEATLTDEDELITSLIQAAREQVEDLTHRQLITATWNLRLDGFPDWAISLPRPPLQAVNSIKYYDTEGTLVETLAEDTDFLVDAASFVARIVPVPGGAWPATQDRPGAVIINYDAGYGDDAADVPAKIRQAMLLLIGHLYENREAVLVGVSADELPLAVDALLRPLAVPLH